MKTLYTRTFSAIVATLLIIGLIYFYGVAGLKFIICLVAILCVRELVRLLYKQDEAPLLQLCFAVFALMIFSITAFKPQFSMFGFVDISVIFCALCIASERRFPNLESIQFFISKAIVGFLYAGLLPGLAYQILNLKNGQVWFIGMLFVIFAGDTLAYCFGMLWGKHKISPVISPKKSFEGAVGGLAGSLLAGIGIHFFLPQYSIILLACAGVVTGLVSQLGDFFESLLKRVANRKDSGTIMPGHGGLLDRLDGVLFGAPIFLTFASLIEKFL